MHKANMLILASLVTGEAFATSIFDWQSNEIHVQYADQKQPFSTPTQYHATTVTTFQHADQWQYGDNFLFIDYVNREDLDNDYYGELYVRLSAGKTLNFQPVGPVKDIGLVLGVNAGYHTDVLKYLPGINLYWDIPGFVFFNTMFTAYIDDSGGLASGGVPSQSDSYMIDIAFGRPFTIGNQRFSIEGHIEYIGGRNNELGKPVAGHILAQPQFRWDAGHALFNEANRFFLGIEYQFWSHKLGDAKTRESIIQLLAVYRF